MAYFQKKMENNFVSKRRAYIFDLIKQKTQYMNITQFDKQNLPIVRKALDEALSKVAEQFGLESISLGNMNFSGGEFRSQLTAKVKTAGNPKFEAEQKLHSSMLGYADNIVGKTFHQNGKTFTVSSLEINRPKYPIVAKCKEDGKSYKFSARFPLPFVGEEKVQHEAGKNMFAH